jgi:signal transduction histidine kinase
MVELPDGSIGRLISILNALAGHTSPGEAFRATACEIGKLICYDHIDIALLSPDRKMHVVYEVGPRTSWSNLAKHPLPIECSPARLVMQRVEPFLLTADALSDERFHFRGALDEPIYEAGLRSRIIVPLRTRGDVIGSLNISRLVPDCYTTADVEIAQICADFLAPYICAIIHAQEARQAALAERRARQRERELRRGASKLTETMDGENRRRAMDLHDQTLSDLARIARHTAALRSAGHADRAELRELEHLVSGCLTELRRIIDDLQPSLLQLFGMRDALDAHLNKSASVAQTDLAVSTLDLTDGEIDHLPGSDRTALYRIAQEAINNAARHARASSVVVLIDRDDSVFRISVNDDGCGIPDSHRTDRGGLTHMQTRATLIGASLKVETGEEGQGTRVTVEFDPARVEESDVPEALMEWQI